jgi:hypothetical protein
MTIGELIEKLVNIRDSYGSELEVEITGAYGSSTVNIFDLLRVGEYVVIDTDLMSGWLNEILEIQRIK